MTLFVLGCAAVFGACVGSFLNVCIYRLPREGLSVSHPRWSFCPACQARIQWWDNLPLLSWCLLRARCRSCQAPISPRYPFVEALTAVLFVAALGRAVGWGVGTVDLAAISAGLFWAAVLSALVVVTFVDLDHRIIPDAVSITGAALAPAACLFLPDVPIFQHQPAALVELLRIANPGLWPDAGWRTCGMAAGLGAVLAAAAFHRWSPRWDGGQRGWWETRLAATVGAGVAVVLAGQVIVPGWPDEPLARRLTAAYLGMGVGAGVLYGVGWLGKIAFRKDAMGLGDVKLMALLGAVLGWQGALLAVFLASLLGSLGGLAMKLVTRSSYIPFGPFLSAAAAILILWPEGIQGLLEWYLGLFR